MPEHFGNFCAFLKKSSCKSGVPLWRLFAADHLKYPGGFNLYFILDGRAIEFSVSNIQVKYKDVSSDEILKNCKRGQDGKLQYNITNDIYIPFEENEVIEYVRNTQKVITVDVDIAYRITGEKIGAGFQIVPRKKEKN